MSDQHPLRDLHDRVNRAFELFYDKIGTHHQSISGHVPVGYEPSTDLRESEVGWECALELPGVEPDDVEVLASEGRITVRGEKATERTEKGGNYLHRERYYGRFARTFSLSDDLDPERADAKLANGVLTIAVPLKPSANRKTKRIKVGRK